MNLAHPLLAIVIGAAVGAAVTASLAESQLGGELDALSRRFGVKLKGGSSQVLAFVDHFVPGESDALKSAALMTVVGGALSGALAAVLVVEVLK